MHKITRVTVLDGYKLDLLFDDGEKGTVDLSEHAGKGIFAQWDEPDVFQAVQISPAGDLVWGEDIDMCADALYLEITGKCPEDVFPALKQEDAHA